MGFSENLKNHIALHPKAQPQDIVKFCYQGAFGAYHIINADTRKVFFEEFSKTPAHDDKLYEALTDSLCRVNFSAWKFRKLPSEALYNMFVLSASKPEHDKEKLQKLISLAGEVVKETRYAFSLEDWESFLNGYKNNVVRHSEIYKKNYAPAYRVIKSNLINKSILRLHKTL